VFSKELFEKKVLAFLAGGTRGERRCHRPRGTASQPYIQQIFVARPTEMDEDAFERKLYVVRKRAELEIAESDIEDKEFFYIPSLSARPSFTKACCWRRRSPISTESFPIRMLPARCAWCISAFDEYVPVGSWPIRIAMSRTTARSTR